MVRLILASTLCSVLAACGVPREGTPFRELVGTPLDSWVDVPYGSSAVVEMGPEGLALPMGDPLVGVHWPSLELTTPYELIARARRDQGDDFFCGLTFPTRQGPLTLVLGGWGGATCGLSCLDGLDAAQGATTRYMWHEPGRWVDLRVRVEAEQLRIWLDGQLTWDLELAGRVASLRPEVLASSPLGWSTFSTAATLSRLAWRPLSGAERGGARP